MDYLTVKDVAALVRRNEETIRRMIRARKLDVTLDNNNRRQGYMIPVDELTRTWDISPEEVQRYIDRARAERASEPPARMPLGPEREQERGADDVPHDDVGAGGGALDDAGDGKDARSGEAPSDGGAERANTEAASGAEQAGTCGQKDGDEPYECASRADNVLVRGARLLAREAERLAAMAREGFMAESGGSDMNDRGDRRTGGWSEDVSDAGERVSEIIGDAYRQVRRAVDQVGEAYTQARAQGSWEAYGRSAAETARRVRVNSQAAIRDAILRAQRESSACGEADAQGADRPCDAAETSADRRSTAHGTGGWAENIRPLNEERRQRPEDVADEVERAARDVRDAAQRAARQAQQDARECGETAYASMRDVSQTVSRMARDIGAGVQRAARQAYAACEEAVRDVRAASDANNEHVAGERTQPYGTSGQAHGADNDERAEQTVHCDASRTEQPDATRAEQSDASRTCAEHAPHAAREHGAWERAQPTPAPEFERFRGRQPDFTPRADIQVDARGIMCEDNNASYQMLMAARRAVEQRMRGTQQSEASQNADACTNSCAMQTGHADDVVNGAEGAAAYAEHAEADAHTAASACDRVEQHTACPAQDAECRADDGRACADVHAEANQFEHEAGQAEAVQSEHESEQAEAVQPEQEAEQAEAVQPEHEAEQGEAVQSEQEAEQAEAVQFEQEAGQAEAVHPEHEPEQPESVPQLPTSDEEAMRARINSLEAQLSRLNGQLEKLTRHMLGEDE